MAITPLRLTAFNHIRSLSLPSESNSALCQFEKTLSEAASCSSLSSMNNQVKNLTKLYQNMDDLLWLPHIQHIISQKGREKLADRVLDGHIHLLDACTIAKDHVWQTKQNVQELLYALRRKDANKIQTYLNSRRKSKKAIHKSLKDMLKSCQSKDNSVAFLEKGNEAMILIRMLKDVELVTITMLESLLAYLCGADKVHGWTSLVSKVMSSSKKRVSRNEFEKIDGLFFGMTSLEDVVHVDEIASLKGMDSDIQRLEEELDCLFRQLIKTRVFLLNLINH